MPINTEYPLVPAYIKKYMNDYYSNTCSSFYFNGELIQNKSTYIEVIPTHAQIKYIKDNFKNKSPYPYETFLDRYLLHINEECDKQTGERFIEYSFVLFLIGKVFPNEGISMSNILSNVYLTATYYPIKGLDINPCEFVNSHLPIRLTDDQIIQHDPNHIKFAENNLPFPNSVQYIKVRTGNVTFDDAYPEGEKQSRAIAFIKDNNSGLISKGGLALFNINYLAETCTDMGLSLSVIDMINNL